MVESPSSWGAPYFGDDLFDWIAAGLPQADAIVLGRRTYLEFAELWSGRGSSSPMAAFLNETPKYVVSSTLQTLDWGPATVQGHLLEELLRLKQQPGKNIQIPGSPTLVRSLLQEGLLDELSLAVVPIVVGAGIRLFPELTEHLPLNLVESRTLGTGVLALTYQPAMSETPNAIGETDHRNTEAAYPGHAVNA